MSNETATNQDVMTTQDVANRLVELCRMGQLEQAQQELYADDTISIEPEGTPMSRVQGRDALAEKSKHFSSMVEEYHGSSISDPIVAGNHFSIAWSMDTTMKDRGRQTMDEICLYEVKDGKIVKEQFFY